MKRILKSSLSIILAITIIFSSAVVGLNECDFSGLFALKTKAASEEDLLFELNEDGTAYSVIDCNEAATGELIIPDTYNGLPMTSIGYEAFYYCTSLTAITIPDSVTGIGDSAFYKCTSLTSVTIGNNVTSIGDSAFAYCTSLTTINIPDSVTNIGPYAFYECGNLGSTVNIPKGVTCIGDYAFCYCDKIAYVRIPSSVTSIGEMTFNSCAGLKGIIVDNDNSYYSTYNGVLFNKLKTVLIQYPGGKTDTSYTIPAGTVSIGISAFSYNNVLTSVIVSDSVTDIGPYAFYYSKINSIEIPNGVITIGYRAFGCCFDLVSLNIPDSVTSIGQGAISYCDGLKSLTIGKGLTDVGYRAIWDCNNIEEININSEVALETLSGILNEKLIKVTLGNEIEYIPVNSFVDCSGLASITIPDSVESIGDYAFYGCSALTTIEIPDSVTSIGACAFYGCSALTTIEIPDSVTSIGAEVCVDCINLETITVGKAISFELLACVYEIENLKILNITDLKSYFDIIGSYDEPIMLELLETKQLYYNGEPIISLVIPEDITNVPSGAFAFCEDLKSVVLNDNITGIGMLAFYGCSNLETVTLSQNLETIDTGAFFECTSLKTITIPDSVTAIGEATFGLCSGLQSVILGRNIKSVSPDAFRGCIALNKIKFAQTKISDISDFVSFSSDTVKVCVDNTEGFISTGTKVTVTDSEYGNFAFTCIVQGDVNSDGALDVLDCAEMELATSGHSALTGDYCEAGDFNDDGKISVNDYQDIINAALVS